ncbi:MAG: phosphomannomutase/phosphoglucomutase [Planctomycetes bacterium]|nr:phosphomannomutase/phosphoglucomutase [Planctomycetota bacterium]
MSIFKACDVRGVVGEELDEPLFGRLGRSLGAMIRGRGGTAACLGGDLRSSTPALKQALLTGLLEAGVKVHDAGRVPTPVVHFAGRSLECPNVIIVTASHNEGRYNGLKFMVAGRPAVPALIEELRAGLDAPVAGPAAAVEPMINVFDDYASWVRSQAAELVPGTPRRLRIVVDPMGGALAGLAGRVLGDAGFDAVTINDEVDPDFAERPPNPAVDGHLEPLSARVREEEAKMGLAFDGDGDRVAILDHEGRIVRPEQIAVLLARQMLSRPAVVYDQKCASVVASAVTATGGRSIMQPSGHGFIKTAMIDEGADLGVEVSGHYFFKTLGGGDDGLLAALLVARVVATADQTLAELIAPIGWPAITPDLRVPVDEPADGLLEQVAAQCGGRVSRLDGVRAEYDGGWALARASITEPVMTFRFEGRDAAHIRQIAEQFLASAPDLAARVLEKLPE